MPGIPQKYFIFIEENYKKGTMIKAGIIDDEPGARGSLQKNIEKYLPSRLRVVFAAASVQEAVACIKQHKPQLVFLDVEMPGANGFELFRHFPKPDFRVVFTTAHKEYAINAIKHSAFDYLLKPINPMELMEVIRKLESQSDKSRFRFELETLITHLNTSTDPAPKVAFPTQSGIEFVKINNIVYCQAENTYTCIHTSLNETIMVTKTLKAVEELLPSTMFYRTHKSYLVNVNYIKSYSRANGQSIVLDNGMLLPVAHGKTREIMELLKNA